MKFPVIIIHNFMNFSEEDRLIMQADALHARSEGLKESDTAYTSNNVVTRDLSGGYSELYSRFLEKSEEIFGELNLTEENSTDCHALCQNCEFWDFNPHIHDNCDINSVYYLKIPKEYGSIMVTDDTNSGIWEEIRPIQDDLIIFPADLWHDPLFTSTVDWRISVNMEILCHDAPTWEEYYEYAEQLA